MCIRDRPIKACNRAQRSKGGPPANHTLIIIRTKEAEANARAAFMRAGTWDILEFYGRRLASRSSGCPPVPVVRPCVHRSHRPSVYVAVHPSVRVSGHQPVRLSPRLSVRWSLYLCVWPSVCPFVRPSDRPSAPLVRPSVRPSVCPAVRPSACLFVSLSVLSLIHI